MAEVFSTQASDGSSTGAVDSATLAWCIEKASAEADEMLFGIYTTAQLTTVPDSVKEIVAVFAMYKGMLRRPEHRGTESKNIPFRQDYLDARARLVDIRKNFGRISATVDPANSGGETTSNRVDSGDNVFSFIKDSNTGEGGFSSGGF